ncbi:MAG TPA: ABC transporter substrate-binding protein [Aeromonadales bacterium]|nr:ABC transporter substrate-binding protein [Aeromonadales bacterium]
MKIIFKLAIVSLVSFLLSSQVFAEDKAVDNATASVAFIKNITTQMIDELNANHETIKNNPPEILKIVDRIIMPHIATKTISRKVMGRYWKKATDEQKENFTREFTTYLKRYYSHAFLSYNDQKLKYAPKAKLKGKKYASVSTFIVETGKKDVSVKYRLYHKKNGDWKIIDIVIEGISLVINNQRQYASQIKTEGLESVIKKLTYKNTKEFK